MLRIASGPDAGREIAFGPGESRLLGRARNADVRIAGDPYLSDLHVGFYADEAGVCVARDLYSSNGTLLNDEVLEEAVLKDGDRVTAGETEIEVRLEGDEAARVEAGAPYPSIPAVPIEETIVLQEPARAAVAVAAKAAVPAWVASPVSASASMPVSVSVSASVPVSAPVSAPVSVSAPAPVVAPPVLPRVIINVPEMVSPEAAQSLGFHGISASKSDLNALLDQAAEPLFALIDAARDKENKKNKNSVLQFVSEAGSEAVSLYSGRRAERLASVAPYLVRITGRISRFLSDCWGNTSGVIVASAAPIRELRAHFKRLLIVETENLDTVYFRFYDPRVLRIFLPSCSPAQARRFFGPVAWLLIDGKAGGPPERFLPPLPVTQNGPIAPEPELFCLRNEQIELFRQDAGERRHA
ncbi:MAG: DUF4123 domain-containing protein [Polyangiaceae bacterium]|nr:DUF4123 domain-containing protein [Polyangiaceae bacterium]